MSPLDGLLAAIETEAKEERARLDAESRARAEAIVSEARKKAVAARQEILHPREAETKAEADRRIAGARLEAAHLLREAREEAFGLLLAEISSRLAALRAEPGYRAALRVLLREGLVALPDAHTLRVDPRDEALAVELVSESGVAELEIEPSLETLGGLVLESSDGRTTLRNTFEERLANAEPQLRSWYGRRLDSLVEGAG